MRNEIRTQPLSGVKPQSMTWAVSEADTCTDWLALFVPCFFPFVAYLFIIPFHFNFF